MAPLMVLRGDTMKRVNVLLRTIIFVGVLIFMFTLIENVKAPALTATQESTPPKLDGLNAFEEKHIIFGPIQQYGQKNDYILEEIPTTEAVEEVNPYIFTLGNDDVDISIGYVEIVFHEGLLAGKSSNFSVVSPNNLGPFETTKDALNLESKTGVIRKDNYGNLLLGLHSGYTKSERPLEVEFLRYSLEEWGKGVEYVEDKLSEIIGSNGTLTFNEHEFQIEIIGAVRLRHEESEEVNLSPETVLDIVTKTVDDQYIALGDTGPFEKAKSEHRLMINFCGWGPNKQTTYYRYIILIDVKEDILTPE